MANTLLNAKPIIPSGLFDKSFDFATTFLHGDLTPMCKAIEIYPNDVITKLDVSTETRMPTPILPFHGEIDQYIWAFFVPNRLVWDKWPEFIGVNEETAGYQTQKLQIPQALICGKKDWNKIGGYFGMVNQEEQEMHLTALVGRAYLKIWNDYFRDEQIQDPILINKSSTNGDQLGTRKGEGIRYYSNLLKLNKKIDRFTSSYVDAYGGPEIKVPLGGIAPVIAGDTNHAGGGHSMNMVDASSGAQAQTQVLATDSKGRTIVPNTGPTYDEELYQHVVPGNLWANLAETTSSAPLDALYLATALDAMNRIMQKYGHRYNEILAGFFGAQLPMLIDKAQFIGSAKIKINIQSIYQQDGATEDDKTKLGQPGAVSRTVAYNNIGHTKFNEHGMLILLTGCKHTRTYSQGVEPFYIKKNYDQFYLPVLANTGYEARMKSELYATEDNKNIPFAYGERYDDLRMTSNSYTGLMNPSAENSLDRWTLAETLKTTPTFNEEFIEENRNSIAHNLVTGDLGPDYLLFGRVILHMVRPVPIYSVPGIVRHY